MLCASFTALGCAPKTVTKVEYRDVYVPVRCNITAPERPAYNHDPVMGVVDLLEYIEKLELLLQTCTEGGK
jgi:hypothetical protein